MTYLGQALGWYQEGQSTGFIGAYWCGASWRPGVTDPFQIRGRCSLVSARAEDAYSLPLKADIRRRDCGLVPLAEIVCCP